MQTKSPPRMEVVKCDEKVSKLTNFVLEYFDRRTAETSDADQDELLVIALSAASPVIRALKSAAGQRELGCVSARLILANVSDTEIQNELRDLGRLEVSWARNARLLDAHEQLVLSDSTCWTGDCMRREPSKRDAFECFADDCRETAVWARTSFERLWTASVPVSNEGLTADGTIDYQIGAEAQGGLGSSDIVAGTRH